MSTLPHVCSTSTTYPVESVTIRRPRRAIVKGPERSEDSTPRGWRGLKRLDWRKWQGMRLRYYHGQDPHVVVNARGREWSYPWDTAVLDILRDVTGR
jgi:hypothetical protein